MQSINVEAIPEQQALIQVGERWISETEIAQEMQHHPAATMAESREAAARALVIRELLQQRAVSLGLCDGAADEADEADEALISSLLEQELEVPEPAAAECERFYQHFHERYRTPDATHLAHVLLPVLHDDVGASLRVKHQGERLLKLLADEPGRFGEFAQRFSACPSRDQQGDLGWISNGQTVEELDKIIAYLPCGVHPQPVRTRYGWHLLNVYQREEGVQQPFEDVREQVFQDMQEAATRAAFHHYVLALESDIGVTGFQLDT